MSTGEWVTVAASCAAVLAFLLDRLVGPGRGTRAEIREFLGDWRGQPERREGNLVITERRPGVMEHLAGLDQRTAQLERNGGGSLADSVHRIEEIVQTNQTTIEDRLAQLVRQIVEARHVAGEAAIVTARTEQAHQRDHGQLVDLLEQMRDRIWERFAEQDARFDEQRLRELTYVAMLHELGIDLELPDPPIPPIPHD